MADKIISFEDLESWKLARELVAEIYAVFRREAASKDFGLRDQAQRAAVSVMTNIAEGFERLHILEKIQFYNIARASCGEVRSLLFVIGDVGYISKEEQLRIQELTIHTGKLLTGLIRSTQARKS